MNDAETLAAIREHKPPSMRGTVADLMLTWHETFGRVKCWGCPICEDTDWPYASWTKPVRRVLQEAP